MFEAMYAQDSFFTLSTVGQIGLVLLSVCLFTVMIWLVMKVRLALGLRLLVAVVTFWLFVMLSPQVYYLYYLMLIDGLPMQWVVRTIPNPSHIFALLSFRAEPTLSAHTQGLLGWLMIAAAAMRKKA